jgi:hypothetical protein
MEREKTDIVYKKWNFSREKKNIKNTTQQINERTVTKAGVSTNRKQLRKLLPCLANRPDFTSGWCERVEVRSYFVSYSTRLTGIIKSLQNMTRRIIWIICLILTIIIFNYFIPVNLAVNHSPITSFFGSFLALIFLIQSIADFKSISELKGKKTYTVLLIFPAFFYLFYLAFHYRNIANRDIVENGIISNALITKKSKEPGPSMFGFESSKNPPSYLLTVSFIICNDTILNVMDVSWNDFNLVSKDERIEIIYSSKTPSNARLLITDKEILKYTNNPARDLRFTDLKFLLYLKNRSIADKYLDDIHLNWRKKSVKKDIWVNPYKKYVIGFNSDNSITYLFPIGTNSALIEYLKNNSNSIQRNEVFTIFQIDSTIVNIGIETMNKNFYLMTIMKGNYAR